MGRDFYREWLGVEAPSRPPAGHQLLGIAKDEGDPDVIERAAKERMRIVKQYQIGAYQKQAVEMLLELSIARTMMLVRAPPAPEAAPPPPAPEAPPPPAPVPDTALPPPGQMDFASLLTRIPMACPPNTLVGRLAWFRDGNSILVELEPRPGAAEYHGDTALVLSVATKAIAPWHSPRARKPAVSPLGDKAAIWSHDMAIRILDLETRQLSSCVPDSAVWPTFTSDGGRICYMSRKGGRWDLWVADLDGRNARQLTHTNGSETCPAASPREAVVAYWAQESSGIQVQRIDGDCAVLMKANVGACPAWSPDGRIISFYHMNNIWLMDEAGTAKRQLTMEGSGVRGHHAWSPDGTRLVYYVGSGAGGEFRILLLNVPLIHERLGLAGGAGTGGRTGGRAGERVAAGGGRTEG